MRAKKADIDVEKRPYGVDKSVPPAFVREREAKEARDRWWRGVTPSGKALIALAVIIFLAASALLAVGLVYNTGGTVRPGPKPGVVPTGATILKPLYANSNARLDMAVLAAGLHLTLKSMSKTSQGLMKDLKGSYGSDLPSRSLTASIDVMADGPEKPTTPRQPASTGSAIQQKYLKKYRAYLSLLTSIRSAAESIPATGPRSAERSSLIQACDDLTRDTTVIISGLSKLGSDPSQDGEIAAGIEVAGARIKDTSKKVDSLLNQLTDSHPGSNP
jgi:hypothetical protein